ncbi:MAG: ParB/Srx family N-terminal domain-containing protein [Pseudobdellovibrionaceae bacterium]
MKKLVFVILSCWVFLLGASASEFPSVKNEILSLPRLSEALPEGTLAWATIEQLHPTQPQTGKTAVKERRKKFEDLLKEDGEKFSKKLYKELKEKYIVPVIIGATPRYDSRFGLYPTLGYLTDRTHTTRALAEMYVRTYGPEAIRTTFVDERGRPLNYVLVRVTKNKAQLSTSEFERYLSTGNRSYLENWTRADSGETKIQRIKVSDLPETVLETTNNHFRGFVSDLQDREIIPGDSHDFSQFRIAETLLKKGLASWDEVSAKPGSRAYEAVVDRVEKYYESQISKTGRRTPVRFCSKVL